MQVLDRHLEALGVGLGGRDQPGFARLAAKIGELDPHLVVGAEAQLLFLAADQLRDLAFTHEHAVAEQRDTAGQQQAVGVEFVFGVEERSLAEFRHRAHVEYGLRPLGVDQHPLVADARLDALAVIDDVDGLERRVDGGGAALLDGGSFVGLFNRRGRGLRHGLPGIATLDLAGGRVGLFIPHFLE